MRAPAADVAHRLAREAEAVCRHYLPNGRREGRYWFAGDVMDTPGRSLFVRLTGPEHGRGAAGKWTDAATGEHGDLLDLIGANRRIATLREAIDEARDFLRMPRAEPAPLFSRAPAPIGSSEAASRLWARSRPIAGTVAQAYLHSRGLTDLRNCANLRFHPSCWYRGGGHGLSDQARASWPALIAAVRDGDGRLTGVNRTYLALDGAAKAAVQTPRRALGSLLGHGVRFGDAADVMAAGEGIETMLSLRQVAPTLPLVAGLSANHLAALQLPPTLRRLYLVRDADAAGRRAVDLLAARARAAGIEALPLDAWLGDLNDDLRRYGREEFAAGLRPQFVPEDAVRFRIGAIDQSRL